MRVVLYGRQGCHLCDDAREVLLGMGVAFAEIDITTDDELHARYLERIPVLTVDGEELFDYFIDPVVLTDRLDNIDGA